MFENIYNLMLIGYIGYAIYVLSEPWHDEIMEVIVDVIARIKTNYNRGKFVYEAKVDTILLVKGM